MRRSSPLRPDGRYRPQPERHGARRWPRRFEPRYASALERLPSGRAGLPRPAVRPRARPPARRRWILLGAPIDVDLAGHGPASHVVVAHLCDAWRDDAGRRPAGLAVGHVVPVGEPLARYTVVDRSRPDDDAGSSGAGSRSTTGILGWGSGAFAAVPHLENEVLDWRGPHAAQGPGRYAPPGQSGSLTIMPGTYGGNQVGMSDFVPSPDRRRAPVAPRDRSWSPRREPVALHLESLDRRPAGERRDPGRRDAVYRGLGQPAGPRPAHGGPDRGPRRSPARGRPRHGHPDAGPRTRRPTARSDGRDRRLGPAAARADAGAGDAAPASSTCRSARTPSSASTTGTCRRRELLAGGPRRDPAGTALDRGAAGGAHPGRGPGRGPDDRRAGPEPGPLHGRRRALPAAGRPSRRDQPGASSRTPAATSSSGRPPMPMSRAGSRSSCRPAGSMSRSSAGSTGPRPGRGSRSTPRPATSSSRSTGRSTSMPGDGSPPTPTSTSSPRRRPSCRPPPRTSTSSTCWPPSGATCTRT